ncbi:MAG: AMP-binding protein [Chloroflexi bacterium]|nr:AMP-binding protein [Chloroflexota bacterium]
MMFPDQEILVFENTRLTYSQVQERVIRLANALRSLGLGTGNRVGVLQANSSQYVEAFYATSKLGGTFVPLNYRAKIDELKYIIGTAEVDALLVGDRYVDLAFSLRRDLPPIKHWIAMEKKRTGMLSLEDLISDAPNHEVEEDLEGDETNLLIFTSGTTAVPKAVMLSYRSFIEYIFEAVEPADGVHWGATLLCAPIYHIAGAMAIMTSIYGGRRLVLMRQFDAREWLRLVQRERITNAFLVPTMLKRLLDEPGLAKADLSSLETLSYGAAPMPLPVIREAIEKLPRKVGFINAFGQTETTSTVTMLLPEDHRLEGTPDEVDKKLRRLSSIGRPLPDVEIMVVDESGREVPRGEIGEILVRTGRLMKGYAGSEDLTREVLVHGWMRTRDLGWMDEDDYVFLAGRRNDVSLQNPESTGASEIKAVVLYPDVPTVCRRAIGARAGTPLREAFFGGVEVGEIVHFLSEVYDSLELDDLRTNYLGAVPNLVSAAAYGFHVLDPLASYPAWLAMPDPLDDFLDPEPRLWRTHDPLPASANWTLELAPGGFPPAETQWHRHPQQELLEVHRLARFARAPLVGERGQLLGTLSFARTTRQPMFDSSDLGKIRVLARHMCVVVGHALKQAEIRERYTLAEGALQVIGAAVVVSDTKGDVKFVNIQARKLIGLDGADPVMAERVRQGLRNNLSEMESEGKRIVTSTIRLRRSNLGGNGSLILRSMRIPSAQRTVVTFLYNLEQTPNFQHLTSLLSKREIEVLELLAQGMHNKEIAESLVVTTNTVKHHLKRIFYKLQVSSRSELLAKAFTSPS